MKRKKDRRCGGMVYAMTNASVNNEVILFHRGDCGRLTRIQSYATGGSGTGTAVIDPLASQGSLILSHHGCFLFAVNAESDSISSFRVGAHGTLTLVDVEPSGGVKPNSLSVSGNLLYVSNVGNASNSIASNITGFRIDNDGFLTPIIGATYPLSTTTAQPACVVFSPDGSQLVVSEVNTNRIIVFQVNIDGTLNGPTINNSSGGGPFGSVFLYTGLLLVSEAGANALSSYNVTGGGSLNTISGSVPNGQSAVCWVAASRCKPYAFTSNTGSGTITTYCVSNNGSLVLEDIVYSTRREIAAPIDSGVSRDGCNFYVLNGNQGSISVFLIRNGCLILLQVIRDTGLPILGAQGLAVL